MDRCIYGMIFGFYPLPCCSESPVGSIFVPPERVVAEPVRFPEFNGVCYTLRGWLAEIVNAPFGMDYSMIGELSRNPVKNLLINLERAFIPVDSSTVNIGCCFGIAEDDVCQCSSPSLF